MHANIRFVKTANTTNLTLTERGGKRTSSLDRKLKKRRQNAKRQQERNVTILQKQPQSDSTIINLLRKKTCHVDTRHGRTVEDAKSQRNLKREPQIYGEFMTMSTAKN